MDIVIEGNKTAIYPLFVTNASTGNLRVSWRQNGLLRHSAYIKPGGQERIFAGELNEIKTIEEQLQRQGYIEKSQASDLILPAKGGGFRAATTCYYTIGQPDNVENISQVVENNETIIAEQVQQSTNEKAAVLTAKKGKNSKIEGFSITEGGENA